MSCHFKTPPYGQVGIVHGGGTFSVGAFGEDKAWYGSWTIFYWA